MATPCRTPKLPFVARGISSIAIRKIMKQSEREFLDCPRPSLIQSGPSSIRRVNLSQQFRASLIFTKEFFNMTISRM
jgi:hypothetical protein